MGFLQHFELETSAVLPYIALKEVAHGLVCLSESQRGVSVMSLVHDTIECVV